MSETRRQRSLEINIYAALFEFLNNIYAQKGSIYQTDRLHHERPRTYHNPHHYNSPTAAPSFSHPPHRSATYRVPLRRPALLCSRSANRSRALDTMPASSSRKAPSVCSSVVGEASWALHTSRWRRIERYSFSVTPASSRRCRLGRRGGAGGGAVGVKTADTRSIDCWFCL